jgi:putative multiple sugar transport system substrate-binding protein
MKKIAALSLILISILSVIYLPGCGSNPISAQPSAVPSDITAQKPAAGKIGISMPTKSLERWNRDGSFLKTKFESQGYTVELIYSGNSVTQQIHDIESMIAGNVDLLVIIAIDGESLSGVLQSAVSAEIPVIAYDRLIMNTDAVAYYVSFDNYTVGRMMGQYVIDSLDLKLSDTARTYNIELTAGDKADNNARIVYSGFMDLLTPYLNRGILKVPSGQIKFEDVATAKWNTATAMNRMQNIICSYYSDGAQLDAALCSNDSTALGVIQAIESEYKGNNSVVITGQDGDEANLAEIIDGKQSMTVYKSLVNEAYVTVDLAMSLLHGETPDAGLITQADWPFLCMFDTKSYDNNNSIIPSYLLVPVVVTKDNMEKELIDTGYYTLGRDGHPKAVG